MKYFNFCAKLMHSFKFFRNCYYLFNKLTKVQHKKLAHKTDFKIKILIKLVFPATMYVTRIITYRMAV